MKNFGWKRDLPDHRDFRYSAKQIKLPNKKDLSADFWALKIAS